MTVSSAAAVNTSVTLIRATTRSAGRNNSLPPMTMAAMTPNNLASVRRPFPFADGIHGRWRDQWECRQHGQNGEILKQQNPERSSPVRTLELRALRQQLQHQRRRGQSETKTHEQRGRESEAQQPSSQSEQYCAHNHLRRTHAENDAPHDPEARWLQLQADDEEQQDDSELREAHDARNVFDEAEAPRPDHHSGRDISEDRAQLQESENRDRKHRGAEQHRTLIQVDSHSRDSSVTRISSVPHMGRVALRSSDAGPNRCVYVAGK